MRSWCARTTRRRAQLRLLPLYLLALAAASITAHAAFDWLCDVFDFGAARATLAALTSFEVVLLAPGGARAVGAAEATLTAILSCDAVAALRPRVTLFVPANTSDAARDAMSHLGVLAPIEGRPDGTYLRYIIANYYTSLPDFVLFAPAAAASARSVLQARLRAFTPDTHLLALAPLRGCACDGCPHEQRVLRRVHGLYGVAPEQLCVEPGKSFASGAFLVSRTGIHAQPLSFYEDMLTLLEALDATSAASHVILEQLWTESFGCAPPPAAVCATPAQPRVAGGAAVPPKTVWLLWLSGWHGAAVPWLVLQVAHSWRFHNPGWHVELVSADNLHEFVRIPYIHQPHIKEQAKSDIIRLHLLAQHGGVWADATVLCLQPLDHWLYDMLAPARFWMYHGTGWPPPKVATRENTIYPASWFMASARGAYLARAWAAAADVYWTNGTAAIGTTGLGLPRSAHVSYDYFWMDALFRELMARDPYFLHTWRQVPYLSCEAAGQSHMLAASGRKAITEQDALLLRNTPPYVLKLSHHKFPTSVERFSWRTRLSATYVAIELARTRRAPQPPLRNSAAVLDAGAP